jgi:cyanophycin synthetase
VEDLAVLKRVIVENVTPKRGVAVLNAEDPIVAEMASSCPGTVTFFANDARHPVMRTHQARGLRVVFVDKDAIVITEGKFKHRFPLADIPLTQNGAIGFQIENAMGSIAAAWALNIEPAIIQKGLANFINDAATAPGRFNQFSYHGATLIADYGHNPDAIIALVKAVKNLPAQRRLVVISGAGDRRDQDIRQQTEILGDAFDEVILYQDQCQRGRADGEVLDLLRQGLQGAKQVKNTQEITGEFLAIDTALAQVQPGDVCLILIDQVDEALAHIAQRVAAG